MTKSGKHCGKRRNCSFWAISTFVTVFKKPSAAEASESVYMRERVNPCPHTDAFWHLCSRQLYKTLWQKEKLLTTSNFSFCHNVFNSFSVFIPTFIELFHVFVWMISKSSSADLLNEGKGLSRAPRRAAITTIRVTCR